MVMMLNDANRIDSMKKSGITISFLLLLLIEFIKCILNTK